VHFPLTATRYFGADDQLKLMFTFGQAAQVVEFGGLFAHVFGGATATLLLSQSWFWTDTPTVKTRDGDGWF
jgi:hypothetical protein